MRAWIRALVVSALGAAVGCGGSTSTGENGSGGTGGSGAKGGSGGGPCDDGTCGPHGAACCTPGIGCASVGPSGSVSCECTGKRLWSCTSSGGTGGSGGCADLQCGPYGAPCCEPGSGCGYSGPNGSLDCNCTSSKIWQCTSSGGMGGVGGCDPSACGPSGAPCCNPGMGCASSGPNGYSCECTASATWQCWGVGGTDGGTGGCNAQSDCAGGTQCCNGKCVNLMNDPYNCGTCAAFCPGPYPYCDYGQCGKPPCDAPSPPPPGTFCCGQSYCQPSQLCCAVEGPGPWAGPICFAPTPAQPTCPIGCPLCQ
jgi:hypothetical protein